MATAAQALLCKAIFFTYALLLLEFGGVPGGHLGYYLLPFTLGNALRPMRREFRVSGRERDFPAGGSRAVHFHLLRQRQAHGWRRGIATWEATEQWKQAF